MKTRTCPIILTISFFISVTTRRLTRSLRRYFFLPAYSIQISCRINGRWYPTRESRNSAEEAQRYADDALRIAEEAVEKQKSTERRRSAAARALDEKAKECAKKAAEALKKIRDAPEISIPVRLRLLVYPTPEIDLS